MLNRVEGRVYESTRLCLLQSLSDLVTISVHNVLILTESEASWARFLWGSRTD